MKRWLLRLSVTVLALALGAVLVTMTTRLPGEHATPSGLRQNQALYVTMRDGTRIAVDVWLPADHAVGERRPVILQMTRYHRARAVGPLQRLAIGLRLAESQEPARESVLAFLEAGYAVVRVDARGTGASFGSRRTEFSPEEIADYGEIVEWIVHQPWAQPRVGAIGASYGGNTAELLAATRHPALKAVAPLYSDFDPQYGLVQPGGARMSYLDEWGQFVATLDRNDVCSLQRKRGVSCLLLLAWSTGVKPVDADDDGELLAAAIAEHAQNADVAEDFRGVEFRDDLVGRSGLRMADTTPYGRRAEIEASQVPMLVWAGWLDAGTAEGALSRYNTFSNPQDVTIGALSHGGRFDTDPLAPVAAAVEPARDAQTAAQIEFFDRHLKSDVESGRRRIRYFTQGSREWHETDVWPPEGVRTRRWYAGAGGMLIETSPTDPEASDLYRVQRDVSSGDATRWHTNMGGGDVVYGDLRTLTAKSLAYTSEPLAGDTEITGSPVLRLHLATTKPDAVVHAFLSVVLPSGESRYVTEGILRALHRGTGDCGAPYWQGGPRRSFERADAMPLEAGLPAELVIGLFPTSIVAPKGSRLQIAIAGADRSMFATDESSDAETWTVFRNASRATSIELPMRDP